MELQEIYRIAGLLSKQVRGELSADEQEELENWKKGSPERANLSDEFSHYTFLEKKLMAEQLCGKDKAYQNFIAWKHAYEHRRQVRRWIGSVAAIAFLFITIAVIFLNPNKDSGEAIVYGNSLPAGESRATLILANGQRMVLDGKIGDTLVEPGVQVRASQGEIKYETGKRSEVDECFNQLEIPRRGEYRLMLADGTRVWLNSESRLKYPVTFHGHERRVYLEGEAYFEVMKNNEMPFVVVSGETAVEVLGTSFNVRAYSDETCIYTTLVEGKVRLSNTQHSLELEPSEQGIITLASGQLEKRKVDVNLYTTWKDGRFVFENQTLEEIMNTLGRWYDVKVFYTNEQVKQAMFNGNLKRYEDFNQIVEMLELTGVAHFKINGDTIIISE